MAASPTRPSTISRNRRSALKPPSSSWSTPAAGATVVEVVLVDVVVVDTVVLDVVEEDVLEEDDVLVVDSGGGKV